MIVLGTGARYRTDDASGLEVVRRLRGRLPPAVALRTTEADAARAVEFLRGHDRAILVDATRSGRPAGTVTRFVASQERLPASFTQASTHGLGLAEALALGRELRMLPPVVIVFGIEGRSFEMGEGLSPEVEAGVEDVVKQVIAELGGAAAARTRLEVRGAVQGVGFRPCVARLAAELRLAGFVRNTPAGAEIEIEGSPAAVEAFLERLPREAPPLAVIEEARPEAISPLGQAGFSILASGKEGRRSAVILPDVATCPDCLAEIFDSRERRYRYPFTNCTNCGPRYSIVESLPYDRERTTMKGFPLCERCRAEYDNPRDRRFHAQPVACPDCGPRLVLWDGAGHPLARRDTALAEAERAIRQGSIVAIKSLSGFHLVADARNEDAVRRLRERKGREEKPFAVLFPSIEAAQQAADISPLEEALLLSPGAPIVLVRRRSGNLAPSVAPDNPDLGILVPSNPLQHLLLADLGFPVVATSGNLSEEPLCADESEAVERLGTIADLFLVHNRPIARPLDDSIVRVVLGRVMVLRRGRGYAPLRLRLPQAPASVAPSASGAATTSSAAARSVAPSASGAATTSSAAARSGAATTSSSPAAPAPTPTLLAVGAHLKSTIALARGPEIVLGEYLGDLGSPRTEDRFLKAVDDMETLFAAHPDRVACDLHPEYPSTRYAGRRAVGAVGVQHHEAHIRSCLADNGESPPALGVAWDGTGYGLDGTIWGGEFLKVGERGFERVAHLRTFRLPGGESAVHEGRKAALGLLYEIFGEDLPREVPSVQSFSRTDQTILIALLRRRMRCPVTSSAGRLFDGLASLLGLCHRSTYEGQAALTLEYAIAGETTSDIYDGAGVDWEPLVRAVLIDRARAVPIPRIAARIHNTLAASIVGVARQAGQERVVVSGGCFQNRYLLERTVRGLEAAGLKPVWPERVPPNDAGIALGQLAAVLAPVGAGRGD